MAWFRLTISRSRFRDIRHCNSILSKALSTRRETEEVGENIRYLTRQFWNDEKSTSTLAVSSSKPSQCRLENSVSGFEDVLAEQNGNSWQGTRRTWNELIY